MTVFKNYNDVAKLRKRYNKNYNLYPVRNTSTSKLLQYIQKRDLASCLEWLENLGYSPEDGVVVLAAVQLVAGLEVGV